MEVQSSLFDGVVGAYSPSLPEIGLGGGGLALALAIGVLGMKVLRILPESLDDALIDPHHASAQAAKT